MYVLHGSIENRSGTVLLTDEFYTQVVFLHFNDIGNCKFVLKNDNYVIIRCKYIHALSTKQNHKMNIRFIFIKYLSLLINLRIGSTNASTISSRWKL